MKPMRLLFMLEVAVNAVSGPLMVFMPAFVKDLLGVTEMSEETAEVSRNTKC